MGKYGNAARVRSGAAQDTTWWVQKLTLQLICLAVQLAVGGMRERMVETMEEILRSIVISGCCRAVVTVRESSSKIKEDNPNRIDKRAARRIAVASPIRATQSGLISEMQPTMALVELRQTVA